MFSHLSRNLNKVRMVALYVMYRDGVPDEDRRRLYQHARLRVAEQDAVNSLSHLGVRITRVSYWLHIAISYSRSYALRALQTRTQRRS